MEYSKSPKTLPQRTVGLLCNVFRLLNNLDPLVPLALVFVVLPAAAWGVFRMLS
jgi:hypothetical protein